MPRRLVLAHLAPLLVLLTAAPARASGLSVRTVEYGFWPDAVAALQGDLHGEGRVIHVFVRDEQGVPVQCSDYTLTLDAIAEHAFAIGRCAASNNATEVRLVHRAALFRHDDDVVPTPLSAGITAVEIRTTGAAGGAGTAGGSELRCSVAVRPYLTNLETGEHVYLQPGRFVLRALTAGAAAESGRSGWTLRSSQNGTFSVDYEVVDTQRNRVVLRDHAAMTCATSPISVASVPDARTSGNEPPAEPSAHWSITDEVGTTCADARLANPGTDVTGSTLGGSRQPMYRVEIAEDTLYTMWLTSLFGGEVNIYAGCPSANRGIYASNVFGGGDAQQLRWVLPAGIYYVAIVDADIHHHEGDFFFHTDVTPDLASTPQEIPDGVTPEQAYLRAHPECQLVGTTIADGVRCSVRNRGR